MRLDRPRGVLADEVAEGIAQAILDGRFPPGLRLRDTELEVEFGVSRTPIREALLRLERVGLVEVVASRFTQVSAVTPEVVRSTRQYAGYQAGVVARMSLPVLTDEELAEAVLLVDRLSTVVGDPVATSAARRELYSYLSQHSRNEFHHHLQREAEMALERNLAVPEAYPESASEMLDNYHRLRAAIAGRHAEEAEVIIREQHGIRNGDAPTR